MLITVTAPKKGLGQTITAINLAAIANSIVSGKVIIIDTNKYCKDIEYFLSDTSVTKGLDDFISLNNANLLNKESFSACVKNVHKSIDIMASNDCLEVDERVVNKLIKYTESLYDLAIIDSISGGNSTTRLLFEKSDVVVVVLNQFKYVSGLAANSELYSQYKDKLVFILNRYMDSYEGKKVRYSIDDVESDLKSAGFDNKVFPLNYDADIINECNDHAVLNSVLNYGGNSGKYNWQLLQIAQHIIGNYSDIKIDEAEITEKFRKRRKLFGLF
ncbi:MAG: hypothetical protein N3B21_05160 [Clostridia bacterium]|nr:hypothetical protein [Clostridia bacterium]